MQIFMIIVLSICGIALFWNLGKMIQLGRFSDAMKDEIDRIYEERIALLHSDMKYENRMEHDVFRNNRSEEHTSELQSH